jgi:hypothetical protein
VATPIRNLVAEYQVAIYSRGKGDETIARRAGNGSQTIYLARIKGCSPVSRNPSNASAPPGVAKPGPSGLVPWFALQLILSAAA